MVSANWNLRVISMDRPIGLNIVQPAPAAIATKKGVRAKAQATPKAGWKSDPRWSAAIAVHSSLVDQIKQETDTVVKESLLGELRNCESGLKSLKLSLRGFREPR